MCRRSFISVSRQRGRFGFRVPGSELTRNLRRNTRNRTHFIRCFALLILLTGWALVAIIAATDLHAGEAKTLWQVEWEKIVQAAKKEGQVTVYVHSTYAPALESGAFQKAFPDIKLVLVSGVELQLERRFMAERRAGKSLADVFMVGVLRSYDFYQAKLLEPIKAALVLPEVVDESKWWQKTHHYADPEKAYLFRYVGSAQLGQIHYNTHLVSPKEFNSFWDFLNPKWKGKMEARDIRAPGTGGSAIRLFYYNPEIGPEFVRRLFSETDMTLFRDRRQGLDWLATGKFAICFWCEEVEKGKQQGLPLESFGLMKEGAALSAGQGFLTLVNQAPHPNAARVFVNWFLSREGQLNFQKALAQAEEGGPDSLRTDIPKDDVLPKSRRLEGVKYLDTDNQRDAMKPVMKLVEETLTAAEKK
jgi:iron(III) transport system substrate-binding protein